MIYIFSANFILAISNAIKSCISCNLLSFDTHSLWHQLLTKWLDMIYLNIVHFIKSYHLSTLQHMQSNSMCIWHAYHCKLKIVVISFLI